MRSQVIARVVLSMLVLSVSFIAISGDMTRVGGWRDSSGKANSAEIEELARFAVDEHNKMENGILKFVRVVKAKEQVVAGILHHLTLEVIEGGNKKFYEAKVWVKPWLNFKQLQEFKSSNQGDGKHTEDIKMTRHVIGKLELEN